MFGNHTDAEQGLGLRFLKGSSILYTSNRSGGRGWGRGGANCPSNGWLAAVVSAPGCAACLMLGNMTSIQQTNQSKQDEVTGGKVPVRLVEPRHVSH